MMGNIEQTLSREPPSLAEIPHRLDLSPGELVRVRTAREIFGTLDERGRLDNLPFMPEMLRYCGRQMRVEKRADKTCGPDHGLRRMESTVFLRSARCSGDAHGGCQAACLLYWKEAWLERVDANEAARADTAGPDELAFVESILRPATSQEASGLRPEETVWQCQATVLPEASTQLHGWYLDQYARDARNWGWFKVVRSLVIEAFNRMQMVLGRRLPSRVLINDGRTYPFIRGTLERSQAPRTKLDLQPGERVRIKTKAEIEATLDKTNHVRGLSFDAEMVKYCGRVATVRARVNHLVDEETGRMVHIKSDCIILEGVVCASDYHRMCPRAIYPYWREAWLERID
jgi:hypothetical protein